MIKKNRTRKEISVRSEPATSPHIQIGKRRAHSLSPEAGYETRNIKKNPDAPIQEYGPVTALLPYIL